MLEEPPHEGQGRQGAGAQLLGRASAIAKRHAIILDANDAVGAQRDAEAVRGQLLERGGTPADRPASHHPGLAPGGGRHLRRPIGLPQCRAPLGPKQNRQRRGGPQEGRIARRSDRPSGRAANGGAELVDVRVKAHGARPGLHHAAHAALPAQEAWVMRELRACRC